MEHVNLCTEPSSAARMYGALGWRVAPLAPGSKVPAIAEWQKRASSDSATIAGWWESSSYAACGVCIVTGRESGLWVLDVDVANGKPGLDTLRALLREHGVDQLPETVVARTPSGGYHYYWSYPATADIRNSASNRLGPGLDVRGEGGQVNAPPTKRGDSKYRWIPGRAPWEASVEPAPEWLVGMVVDRPRLVPAHPEVVLPATVFHDTVPAFVTRYNAEHTWPELLTATGWTLDHTDREGVSYWVRPDKDAREGISASTNYAGSDLLYVWTTSLDWLPSDRAYDRYGYMAHRDHGGDFEAAARRFTNAAPLSPHPVIDLLGTEGTDEGTNEGTAGQSVGTAKEQGGQSLIERARMPVESPGFWTDQPDEDDLLVPPFLCRGRAHALFAEAKAGKSYVVLQALAAACVPGHTSWAEVPDEPITMLYLDYEMTEADLRERLRIFGYDTRDDWSRFHYIKASLLGADLDTDAGGVALLAQARRWGCQLVVIDTMSRAVSGEENAADTVRKFYQCTGRLLKADGIAWLRIDHAGKDRERGQRGSSGKNDDVDIVWRLDRLDGNGAALHLTHSRVFSLESEIMLRGVEDETGGIRHYRTHGLGRVPAGVSEKADQWRALGIPLDANRKTARAAGLTFKSSMWQHIRRAVIEREERSAIDPMISATFPGAVPLNAGTRGDRGDRAVVE